jgi:DNA-binding MarR family transcriptional regulator
MDTNSFSAKAELVFKLATEIRVIHRMLKMRVREHGGSKGLAPSQIAVLLRLEQNEVATVSSLARAEGMRPQSMGDLVATLQEAGLVRGVPDPGDGRKTLLSLTPKCVSWMKEGRVATHDWLSGAISLKLSEQEQLQLRDALTMLRRLLQE